MDEEKNNQAIIMISPVKDNRLLFRAVSVFEFCDVHLPHLPDKIENKNVKKTSRKNVSQSSRRTN